MKINPCSFCTLEITPENDAERIWLAEFVKEFSTAYPKQDGCFVEFKSEGGNTEEYIEKPMTDVDSPVMVDELRINPLGF